MQGVSQLNAKLARLQRDLPKIGESVAKESVGDVAEAVRGEIGDLSLSRWFGGNTQIVGRAVKQADGGYAVEPVGRAKGPMRILQDGRRAYAGGDRRNSGMSRSGVQKSRRVKRAGKGTAGKGTWSDAERLVQQRAGKRAATALHRVMASTFSKG